MFIWVIWIRNIKRSIDLNKLFNLKGVPGITRYIVNEIQVVYINEGVGIADKYVEVIIRQMLSRLEIVSSGDTALLPGDIVEKDEFIEAIRNNVVLIEAK